MNLALILDDALAVVSVLKQAYALGVDAAPLIEQAYDVLSNNKPLSAEQRAALAAQEVDLRDQLNAGTIPADQG